LAAVLTGLQQSRHAFMVKMMDVEHAADSGPAAMPDMPYPIPGGGVPMPTMPTTPQSGADLMRQRYGRRLAARAARQAVGAGREFSQRYGGGPGARPPGTPGARPRFTPRPAPTRRGPETVLEEKQLKVTLTVDAVRLPLTGSERIFHGVPQEKLREGRPECRVARFGGGGGALLKQVADENRRLEDIRNLNLTTAPQELAPMDTSTNLTLLARIQRRERWCCPGPTICFNPVTWQRRGDQARED
jgi:hypothetical protein